MTTNSTMADYKRSVSFLDSMGHRAVIDCEVTQRNGYPEFTASGRYLGSFGQCLDSIKPKAGVQLELICFWEAHHLKDVSHLPNFEDALNRTLDAIEEGEEVEVQLTPESTDDQFLKQMDEYGIQEEFLHACRAYIDWMGTGANLSDFEEAYEGEHDSDEDFAEETAENIGAIDEEARWPNNCIDWERAARELMFDYYEQDGFYFRNC